VTDEELAAIRARADAASPGPWPMPEECGGDMDDRRRPLDHEGCEVWPWHTREDMEFAYRARQDVPDLLAEVERLGIALEKVRADPEQAREIAWSALYGDGPR
jgi:hypothetical protein